MRRDRLVERRRSWCGDDVLEIAMKVMVVWIASRLVSDPYLFVSRWISLCNDSTLSIASEHQRIESHILRQQRCDNAVEILSYCFPGADFEPENPRVLPSTQSLVKNIFRRHLDKLPEEPMEEKLKQLVTPDVQVYIRGELHDPLEFFQRQEKTFHIRHVPSVRSMDPLNQRLCFSLDVGFGLQQPATAHVFVHFNDWDYRVSKIIVPSLRNLSTLREIRV